MKKYLLTTLFLTLFVCTANHAQTITFNFIEGTMTEGIWSQTKEGVTCSAFFDDDGTNLEVADLTTSSGATFIDSSLGMYMGRYVTPPSADHRKGFARPGARITFSHDVRLKSYTLGRLPENQNTVCVFVGGNVTGIASHSGNSDDHTGERAFVLESLVPADKTIATTVVGGGFRASIWRITTLTVELEPYVEPVIPIPEGSETGITRISTVGNSKSKHGFALKNGRLRYWSDLDGRHLSRDFIFDGGESGVLDFWASMAYADSPKILLETVEGYVIFTKDNFGYDVLQPLSGGTLPHSPDQIGIIEFGDEDTVMALKDGEIYFDGVFADEFLANMPAELSSGGVSEIAVGSYAALAVKDGELHVWGGPPVPGGAFTLLNSTIPSAITNGSVLHLAVYRIAAVVQLNNGEVIVFGQASSSLSEAQTSREIFADLRYENEHIIAFRADGSFLMEEKQVGINVNRYNVYDGGAFYVEDETGGKLDFWLRGLESLPTIVQQLGYEQIAFGRENAMALLPGGRVVIWGGVDTSSTNSDSAEPTQTEAVPAQINEILFPQNAAPLQELSRPNAGELLMLKEGGMGIQWGGNGNPQYEVQVTNDINDESSWQSLTLPFPEVSDSETLFYRIVEITDESSE